MGFIVFILLFLVILLVLYPVLVRKHRSMKVRSLRRECQKQLRLPEKAAQETVDEFIKRLEKKYPGKKEEWYLEKILYDLSRDRR